MHTHPLPAAAHSCVLPVRWLGPAAGLHEQPAAAGQPAHVAAAAAALRGGRRQPRSLHYSGVWCACLHLSVCVCTRVCVCVCECECVCRVLFKGRNTRLLKETCTLTLAHMHVRTKRRTHKCTHTRTHTHTRLHWHTYIHICTCAHTYKHIDTRTHTRTQANKYTITSNFTCR